jgi:hypothetical protein
MAKGAGGNWHYSASPTCVFEDRTVMQSAILRWARIAGSAGIVSVILTHRKRHPDRDRNSDQHLAVCESRTFVALTLAQPPPGLRSAIASAASGAVASVALPEAASQRALRVLHSHQRSAAFCVSSRDSVISSATVRSSSARSRQCLLIGIFATIVD